MLDPDPDVVTLKISLGLQHSGLFHEDTVTVDRELWNSMAENEKKSHLFELGQHYLSNNLEVQVAPLEGKHG